MKKALSVILTLTFLAGAVFAQSHNTTQGHNASVTQIAGANDSKNPDAFFTSGEDGYIIKWNADGTGDHYQVSELWVKLIAVSPNGNEIAIYETDGGSINRVSVWDWKSLKRKYTIKYLDTISSLKYSAKGKYLIVGTSSISGVQFLKAGNGQIENGKLKNAASIVNYIYTSDSEKTAVFYSGSGSLSYYNLQNGQQKTKFTVTQGMSQAILFNDAKVLAGLKGNDLYLINAYKGKQITNIPAAGAVILSSEKDNVLYYLVREGGQYSVYSVVPSESLDTAKKIKEFSFSIPSSSSIIVTGTKLGENFVFGTRNGQIYTYSKETGNNATAVSNNNYKNIYDVKQIPGEDGFYVLTEKAIYKTSYETTSLEKIVSTNGQREFYPFDDKIVLWSNSSMNAITQVDVKTKKFETLFTPKGILKKLKFYNDGTKKYILEIESNGVIELYDYNAKTVKQIYTGTGIQDAVVAADGFVYISKAAAIFPNTPLLKVNIKTLETVPCKISGNIAFNLEQSDDGKSVYGIIFHDDPNDKNTYVFSYGIEKGQYKEILKFAEEDTDAFTYFADSTLFTNIGKNSIYSYNVKKNKKMMYKRSAAIPVKACQNNDYVVILNSNGSLSWAKANSDAIIADWYLTQDEQWFEFNSKKK